MVDEMLTTMIDVLERGQVQEATMLANLEHEIPKLVSEGVLMLAVKKGGNRQELHEAIRQYTVMEPSNFIDAVCKDERFNLTMDEVLELTDIDKLVGAAPMQVTEY
jgi:adenylosuccinate lyase